MQRHIRILDVAIANADKSETHVQVGAVLVKGNQTWYGATKDRQILGGQFTGMSVCAEKDAMFQVRHARNLKNTIVRTSGLGVSYIGSGPQSFRGFECPQHSKGRKDR